MKTEIFKVMVSSWDLTPTSPLKKTRQKISEAIKKIDAKIYQVECRSEKCALIGPGMKERHKGMLDYFRFSLKSI